MATAPRLPSDPQPHPPTETGPLTGVANFVWNGTTWVASDGSGGGGGGAGELGYQPALIGAPSGFAGDAVTRGWLIQGQVHVAPPTYYTGNDYPMSLDTSGSLRVVTRSAAYSAADTFTRPADVVDYTAGDVVGPAGGGSAAREIVSIGPSGGRVMIIGARLSIDPKAFVAALAGFRLALYSAAPASAFTDNAAFTLPVADLATFKGFIELGTPLLMGASYFCEIAAHNKPILLTGSSLWGYLISNGAFTPVADMVFNLDVHAMAI